MNVLIDFLLYDLYKSGVHNSGIGLARFVLSGFFSVCSKGHIDIRKSVLVKTFMRGVFNKRPALPKYITTWNPAQVLKYLESFGSELTFLQRSQKVCRLLVLLTGQPGQSFDMLKVGDVSLCEDSIELNFTEVLTHTRPGVHQDNHIRIDVSLLQLYICRTSVLKVQKTQLFIRTQPPFKGVACATISRLVKI